MEGGLAKVAAGKGLALAEKGVEEAAKYASKIREALTGSFKILNEEIVMYCPEQVQRISIAFEASGGIVSQKMRFPFGKPLRVRLQPLRSLQDITASSTVISEDGFEIDTKGMSKDDLFLLDAEYKVSSSAFLDALVQRTSARELPKDRESEYWMHAELKHPKLLQTRYGKLDLRDVDFDVDVGVSQDIKTVVPPAFKWELQIGAKLLAERDPRKKRVLGVAHTAAIRSRGQGSNLTEILGDLQELFFPDTFRRFVQVTQDFRYSDCQRGSSFYDTLPFPTWPKSMTVISRTDLNLERFAANGILVYKKAEFLEKVRKILGELSEKGA